jgi:ribonuclease HI
VSEPLKGDKQTNNRAELTAIVRALDIAPRNRAVCIYTDSSYSVNSLTHWVDGWRRNNWMGARGRPVENRDLIEAVLARIDERREQHGAMTQIQWLRGHDGDAGNTEADKLAVNGAKKAAAA